MSRIRMIVRTAMILVCVATTWPTVRAPKSTIDVIFTANEGDSAGKLATFKGLGLEEENIDLALVHFWFPLHPEGEKIILEVLKPDHVGLIHLPKKLKSDAPSKIDAVKSNYKDIFLFVEPGEKKIIR